MLRLLAILPLVLVSACATIVKGSNQTVTVTSTPPAAGCTLDRTGARLGTVPMTPGSVMLQRSSLELVVTCSKDGYLPASRTLVSNFNGATFGNLLFGGLVGVIVDASSGANYSYPETVQVDLAPGTPALPPMAVVQPAYVPGTPIRLAPVSALEPTVGAAAPVRGLY